MVISQYQGRHKNASVARALGLYTRESRSVAHAALANAPFDPQQAQHHKTVFARRSLIKNQIEN